MTTRWRIEMLGALRARREEQTITRFRTQKTGALLAFLALYNDHPHPRETLSELLWPDAELETGRNNLRLALSALRRQLEPPETPSGTVLQTDRLTVQLNPQAVTTDVAEFDDALRLAVKADGREKIAFLSQAVDLYRGPLLPGYYESWIVPPQLRLEDSFAQAALQLLTWLQEDGDLSRAISLAHQALRADPLREELHFCLMRLHIADRQPAAALRQYAHLERLLEEQFEEKPSAEARALAARLRQETAGEKGRRGEGEREGTGSFSPSPPLPFSPAALPSGTVTFLLTDIEGSTALAEQHRDTYPHALQQHHTLLRAAFEQHNGSEFKETGDGFLVAFDRAGDALACAMAAQKAVDSLGLMVDGNGAVGLVHPPSTKDHPLKVRMALHTGEAVPKGGDYHSPVLNRAAKLLAAGHGGQILCSEATASLLRGDLPESVALRDLGLYSLPGIAELARLFDLQYPDRPLREFPPLNARPFSVETLPLQLTRFFGREEEIARLTGLLSRESRVESREQASSPLLPFSPSPRLVTLTGPGGTGKTRLALEVAGRLAEAFQGRVWFVPLADISDGQLIGSALQEALHLPRTADVEPLEQVIAFLSREPALLVLDNFEHLVEEGAAIVKTLLARVPVLTCLVTSRQRLALAGEQEFMVAPLPVPAPDVSSSKEGRSAESPSEEKAAGGFLARLLPVASIQLFVDRAQLARPGFELTLSNGRAVAELCSRLEGIPLALELAAARAQVMSVAQMLGQLGRRLDFFVSRQRDVTARHRSLRSAMEWSYHLLPEELREFFARLSVFRGGWTAEAAEAVCEEPLALDYLAQLREASLIWTEERGEEMRFRMLETLREFAAERVAEKERIALAWRHADYFLQLAEAAQAELTGPQQGLWLDRLETEHDNLRVALLWYMQTSEGQECAVRLAGALWQFWHLRGYLREARERLTAALALPATDGRATAFYGAGVMAIELGDYTAAHQHLAESLRLRRETGDREGVATSLNGLGIVAYRQSDYAASRAFYEESLAIMKELDNKQGIGKGLTNLAHILLDIGDYVGSRALRLEALALCRELGDESGVAINLDALGTASRTQGDYTAARTYYEEALEIHKKLGNRPLVAGTLNGLGNVAYSLHDYAAAQERYQEALAINREIGNRAWEANNLAGLGNIAHKQGDFAQTRALHTESLEIRRELGDRFISPTLDLLAVLDAAQGRYDRAARLLGAAIGLREALGMPLPLSQQEDYAGKVAPVRSVLGEEAFADAYEAGRAMTWEQAIEFALQAPPEESLARPGYTNGP